MKPKGWKKEKEKKRQIITGELIKETEAFLHLAQDHLKENGFANMEWLERGLREALFKDATGMLESLLNDASIPVPDDGKGPGERVLSDQKKTVHTVFGKIALRRNYYYHREEQTGRYPLDQALGLMQGYSPGMVRLICRAGASESYKRGRSDLKAYANIEVEARQIHRMVERVGPLMRQELQKERVGAEVPPVPRLYVSADGTGIPMRKEELKDTPGKKEDGPAKTKEVKVGCIFTEHPNEDPEPFRDIDSTTYVATMRPCSDFGLALRQEAFRRGMGSAQEVIVIADGANWIWEMVRLNFNGALEILDYYHAAERLSELVDKLVGKNSEKGQALYQSWKAKCFKDKITEVIEEATAMLAHLSPAQQQETQKDINYFINNKHRMNYGTYKKQGYFYGSGVVEAGCKTLVGRRAKQSGMFWSKQGAENVLAIRAAIFSNRFDPYWDKKYAA